jgi:hypothetical protein
MNKNITSTHFTQKQACSSLIKKRNQIPGQQIEPPQKEAQDKVLKKCSESGATPNQSKSESEDQSSNGPEDQPENKPIGYASNGCAK